MPPAKEETPGPKQASGQAPRPNPPRHTSTKPADQDTEPNPGEPEPPIPEPRGPEDEREPLEGRYARSPPESERIPPLTDAEAKAARQVLGALSVLSGVMLLTAPQLMARVYGLPLRPWLARAVGARDVLVGVGLTTERSARSASLIRALADTLDVGLIAAQALREHGRARAAGLRMSAGAVLATCALALHRRLAPARSAAQCAPTRVRPRGKTCDPS